MGSLVSFGKMEIVRKNFVFLRKNVVFKKLAMKTISYTMVDLVVKVGKRRIRIETSPHRFLEDVQTIPKGSPRVLFRRSVAVSFVEQLPELSGGSETRQLVREKWELVVSSSNRDIGSTTTLSKGKPV